MVDFSFLRASDGNVRNGSRLSVPTVHGYYRGEGMAFLRALLPNKATNTYVETFCAIRRALIDKFGDLGEIRRFLIDFEMVAIKRHSQVFTQAVVKGCSFHFRQAILRRANQGLQAHYNTNVAPEIRDWIRAIMAMTLLPAFTIPYAWFYIRQTPPSTSDASTAAKVAAFAKYFEDTWINGSFPPVLWSQYTTTPDPGRPTWRKGGTTA